MPSPQAEEEAKGNVAKYMGIGGKGVAALKRLYGDRFTYTFEECAKAPLSQSVAAPRGPRGGYIVPQGRIYPCPGLPGRRGWRYPPAGPLRREALEDKKP